MKVAIAYATDFGTISLGGILSIIRALGRRAPDHVEATYFGVGELSGGLPRPQDRFISLLPKVPTSGSLNLAFSRKLRTARRPIGTYDVLIAHRAEHVLPLRKNKCVTVLHGGTLNAWRAKRGVFGLAYPVLELYAAKESSVVLSVAPQEHWRPLRYFGQVQGWAPCFDSDVFDLDRTSVKVAPHLVVASRLVREKRVDVAIESAARLRWPLHIAGAGPERSRLEQLAKKRGVDAIFHGQLSPIELAALYARCPGVFLMTSAFEGFPISMVEAAACGLPVAALKAPGLSYAVESVGGHLASDVVGLPAAVRRAREVGNSVGAGAIRERFGLDNVARGFWDVVQVHSSQ